MTDKIQQQLALFIENDRTLFNAGHGGKENRRLAAFFYTMNNQKLDFSRWCGYVDMLAENSEVKFFDRGFLVSTLLSLENNGEELLNRINIVNELMVRTESFWWDSDFMGVACYLVAHRVRPENYQLAVDRISAFYNGMKANKRIYVDESYYCYITLLGLSSVDVQIGIEQVERFTAFYKSQIKPREGSLPFLPLLSVLSRIDNNRLVALRKAFNKGRLRFADRATIPAIGILAQLPLDVNTIVSEVLNAEKILRKQVKWNFAHGYAVELLLTAAMLVTTAYLDEVRRSTAGIIGLPDFGDLVLCTHVSRTIFWAYPITAADSNPTSISFSAPKGRRQ